MEVMLATRWRWWSVVAAAAAAVGGGVEMNEWVRVVTVWGWCRMVYGCNDGVVVRGDGVGGVVLSGGGGCGVGTKGRGVAVR
ncbi:hypothetical protein Tco_0116891, partial [Tanacetum coccineum]